MKQYNLGNRKLIRDYEAAHAAADYAARQNYHPDYVAEMRQLDAAAYAAFGKWEDYAVHEVHCSRFNDVEKATAMWEQLNA